MHCCINVRGSLSFVNVFVNFLCITKSGFIWMHFALPLKVTLRWSFQDGEYSTISVKNIICNISREIKDFTKKTNRNLFLVLQNVIQLSTKMKSFSSNKTSSHLDFLNTSLNLKTIPKCFKIKSVIPGNRNEIQAKCN